MRYAYVSKWIFLVLTQVNKKNHYLRNRQVVYFRWNKIFPKNYIFFCCHRFSHAIILFHFTTVVDTSTSAMMEYLEYCTSDSTCLF